jgi:hypothetical protein
MSEPTASAHPFHFLDFTEDFCTWAIFYGPDGGEEP